MAEHLISREEAESDLLGCAAFLAESITSRDGVAEAMSAVVPRFLDRGEVDLAAELANLVDDPFYRDKLLTQVAEKCAEMDDDDYAVQLAEAIEDPGLQSQAFESIALQKAGKGQIEKAIEISENVSHPDYVQAGIAVRLAADGKWQEADEMLAQIEFASARVSALQAIAGEGFRGGNTERAVDLLDRAAAAADDIEHNEEKIRTLVDIGNSFVEAKRNDKAIEAYEKARAAAEELGSVHRDSFLAGAALGFLHAGSLDLAERTLDLVSDKTQIASALLGYAREFWNKEQREDAFESIEESYQILKSQRETETRDSRARFRLFTQIAAQFAGFGKGERAIEIAHSIEDPDEQVQALTQVAGILAVRNDDEQARQALNAIDQDASRVFALIVMSDSKAKNNDREAAVSLLGEADHLVETVEQLTIRATAHNDVARRYLELGEREKALEAARASFQTIAAIRDSSRRAVELANLSDVYKHLELSDEDRTRMSALIRV